jgi:hemerythrin
MTSLPTTKSVWRESMEIGIPLFDEQRRDLAGIIELLDIDPAAPITEENFLGRFSALQVMMAEFFNREESLMVQLGVPGEVQQRMIGDHNRILDLFNEVYMDSMERKQRTAEEIYFAIREAVETDMLAHGQELRRYAKGLE